jgi:transketolase
LVLDVFEGNNVVAIKDGLDKAKAVSGQQKPVAILLHTVMGNGVDFMMHTHAWHGKAPNDEQLAIGLAQNEETLGDY